MTEPSSDFIRDIVLEDMESGACSSVVTRFPPEPNGYPHIGHAKAASIDFGIAAEFGGKCHLRFDDTNPSKEDEEYVRAIQKDIRWLGWDWGKNLFYASDYFEQMYQFAEQLIKAGDAYVDDLTSNEIREYRGTLTEPGRNSPHRDRTQEENMDLFSRMRAREFPDGSRVLRAKIDMASPNLNLRDPVMYRIMHATHHRQGDKWCIYPTYDWAHGLEDSIEGITHSLCDLDFENHRPLYDWFLDRLDIHHPKQREFARLNITYTILSKRKLLELVDGGHVDGWDDPRMPTLSGLRRRGYTPSSIQSFLKRAGVTKVDSVVDIALLEYCLREELNKDCPRVMGVLKPLKLVITNYPEDKTEDMEAINNPEDAGMGTRKVPFSKELYIEQDDFREEASKKFFRLVPGREVRLRYAYLVTCTDVVKNKETGEVIEVHCRYDPETKGGNAPDGRKVKGTIHWVSAKHALDAEVRIYDRLFLNEKPEAVSKNGDFKDNLNPDSKKILTAKLEPSLADAGPGTRCQFERKGYFIVDSVDSSEGTPIFNQIVPLRDSWAKIQKKQGG
ncbi:MAG: glutamine--tRNA ligase/YqeY domain fusion protein [Kiritimatiellae bacterium]|nr:glutamine--tRNA ligase/YqeY domain fusion protein [Kiritimatiellia bacterium]